MKKTTWQNYGTSWAWQGGRYYAHLRKRRLDPEVFIASCLKRLGGEAPGWADFLALMDLIERVRPKEPEFKKIAP